METLTPAVEQSEQPMKGYEADVIGPNMSLKNIQFLNYLGLKDEMFNPQVMEKVAYLSDKLELSDLQQLDWKVGQGDGVKIDRLYAYLKLDLESREIENNLNLINEAKKK